jgi:hypothetical protein
VIRIKYRLARCSKSPIPKPEVFRGHNSYLSGRAEDEKFGLKDTSLYPLPTALRTLSGVSGGAIHLPVALATAQAISWVVAIEWLMPEAP